VINLERGYPDRKSRMRLLAVESLKGRSEDPAREQKIKPRRGQAPENAYSERWKAPEEEKAQEGRGPCKRYNNCCRETETGRE
jgi:hypothetical protein